MTVLSFLSVYCLPMGRVSYAAFFEVAINPIAVMGNPQHLHTPPNCTTHLWKPVAQCHAAAVQNRLDFCSPQAQLQWWSSTNRAQIYLFRFPVKAFCDVLLGTPSSQVCVQAWLLIIWSRNLWMSILGEECGQTDGVCDWWGGENWTMEAVVSLRFHLWPGGVERLGRIMAAPRAAADPPRPQPTRIFLSLFCSIK